MGISHEEQQTLMQEANSDVAITLKDGTTVKTYSYHYLAVRQPSNLIFGSGQKIDTVTGSTSSFRGKLSYTSFDSVYEYEKRGLGGKERIQYYDVWISGSEKVRFRRDNCVIVSAEQGPGLWVTGYVDSSSSAPFFFAPLLPTNKLERHSVRIPFDEIVSIDEWKMSGVKTTLCAVGVAGFLTLFVSTRGFSSLRGKE